MIRKIKPENHTHSHRLIRKIKLIFRLEKNKNHFNKTQKSVSTHSKWNVKAQNFGESFAILEGRNLDDKN